MNKEFNLKRFLPLIHILSVLLVVLLAFKLAMFLIPFVIALLVVSLTKKIVYFLHNKYNMKLSWANFIVISIFYLFISLIILLIIIITLSELYSLSNLILSNSSLIRKTVMEYINNYDGFQKIMPEFVQITMKNAINYLLNRLTSVGILVINYILSLTKQLPILMVYVIITITATYLMAADMEAVKNFFDKQFPKSWLEKFNLIRVDVFEILFKYIKTQLLLIFICFLEVLIGLNFINIFISPISYILVLSTLIAIVDALPVLGTATVLIPWSIYLMVQGNIKLGIAILLLYIIITILRNIFEPRIISSSLNIDPLVSLISLFVGFKLFGVVGFLFGPILFTVMTIVFDEEIKKGFFKILSGEEYK